MKLKKKSKPEAESKVSTFAAEAANVETQNEFMNPIKRGRPKGSKNNVKIETPPDLNLDKENVEKLKTYLTPVVDLVSEVGYRVSEDEKGRLSSQEIEIITSSAASCVNLYLPNVLGRHADLIVLTVTMAQWSVRVYMLRQMNLDKLRRQHSPMNVGGKDESVSAGLGGEIMQ